MKMLSKLYNFVLYTTTKYNIDESHGLSHAMDILGYASNIFDEEVVKHPQIKHQEKIIYVSSILHDMCDKKYMDQHEGIENINTFIGSLKDDTSIPIITVGEEKVINDIISTMSYSYVKANGFPDLGEYQTAYNIVREADLLCAYDFNRCMIYQMYNKKYSLDDAYSDGVKLFNTRVLKHNDDGLLLTEFAKNNYKPLETKSRHQISQWKKLLGKKL